MGLFFDFSVRFCHLRLQKRGKLVFKFSQTMVDVINGMFCVSYQIIRNHKECEGVLYAFDESNFSFSFSYWPWAFGSLVLTRGWS